MNQLPAAGLWTADPATTTASFEATNFLVSKVPGTIAVRSGAVQTDPQGRPISVVAELEAASITTGNPRRDNDLRSPRFLDAAAHSVLSFSSASISAGSDGGWTVDGVLTVGEASAPMRLAVQLQPPPVSRPDTGAVQVVAQGHVDRVAVGIKAPSFLIGRTVRVTIVAVLVAVPSQVTA